MRRIVFFLVMIGCGRAFGSGLGDYARWDSRLSVQPILQSYDQIAGFQGEAQRWDNNLKGKYGPAWTIKIY